jgi:protein O-GlcNAc transferase
VSISDSINQAFALHQSGALETAEPLYLELLKVDPGLAHVRHLLGVLRHQRGDPARGARSIKIAIAQMPDQPVFLGNLSTLLIALADPLGEKIARRSLILAPGFLDGLINLATARLHRGATDEAIQTFRDLIRRTPDRLDLHDRLANALEAGGYFDRALPWRRRQACFSPDSPEIYGGVANSLTMIGDGDGARRHLICGTTLKPTAAGRFRSAHVQNRVPRNAEEIARCRARLHGFLDQAETEALSVADPIREIGVTNFSFTYHDQNNRELASRTAEFNLRVCPSLGWTAPHCRRRPTPGRRIRLAIVSVLLGSHTIGKLFGEILSKLPRERFEVIAASHAKTSDPAWVSQMRGADAQITLSHDLSQARQQLASVEADILLYLDIGMDPFSYYLAFARLAPVQAVCVGHPDTTGVPNIDYFLTTKGAEPADWREHYSERAILLDEFPFFYKRPPAVANLLGREELGLPERATLYTCPQTLFKMHPDHDDVFLEILRRDPKGRLMLIESAQSLETKRMRERLADAGPDVIDRVHFQRRMNGLEYLGFVGAADLLVETFGFAGGNSTYEALSTGTPILAYAGKHMRARVTMDLLAMIGLGDCMALDRENYISMAVEMANDTAARRDIRRRVPEAAPGLFERQSAVTGLAVFLERAVDASRTNDWLTPGPLSGQ